MTASVRPPEGVLDNPVDNPGDNPVDNPGDNPVDNPGDGSKSANENNDLIFFEKIAVNGDFNQFNP